MKLSSIQQICKGAKRIELFSDPSAPVQYISDGGAFYPLYGLPKMEEENVFTLFDIPEKKQALEELTALADKFPWLKEDVK